MTQEISQEKVQELKEIIKDGLVKMEQKPEGEHDFFYLDDTNQNTNVMGKYVKRRIKPYMSSRVKTRNFLSNIAYLGVKSKDFIDSNFVFNITTLITKNINPFSFERKITDSKNRDIIYMFWGACIEKIFYKHICENENFIYLNGKNVLYTKTGQVVMNYLNKDPTNIIR